MRAARAIAFAREVAPDRYGPDLIRLLAIRLLRNVPPWPSRKEAEAYIDAALSEPGGGEGG